MTFKRLVPVVLVLCAFGVWSAAAQAETSPPAWRVMTVSNPTNLLPGDMTGSEAVMVTATNVGGASTDGSRITVGDVLPAGLTAVGVRGVDAYKNAVWGDGYEGDPTRGVELSCALAPALACTTSEKVDPGDTLILTIQVDVSTDVEGSSEVNGASVSGGGAVGASVSNPVTISSATPGYGVAKGGLIAAASSEQAGAHPNVTVAYFLNTINKEALSTTLPKGFSKSEPVSDSKDVSFDLPPGLVGTTVGMPRCTMADVADYAECPRDAMVGTATLIVLSNIGRLEFPVPVFNIEPAPGEPAAFAFNALFFPVRLDTSVLSDGEYNVRFNAPDITTGAGDYFSSITIWGVPAEHDGPGPDSAARAIQSQPPYSFGGPGVEVVEGHTGITYEVPNDKRVPLVTYPSQCSAGLVGLLETDSWAGGGGVPVSEPVGMGLATGCGSLAFRPSVSMLPDTLEAGAPAGYSFGLNVPQNTEAEGVATPDVKKVVATLPLGTVISPSAADGLGDCSSEQFGLHSGVPGACPRDSQVGTVAIESPAIEEHLNGVVYLASPECDPCSPSDAAGGRMVRLFVQVVGEGESGIVVKLEGTGQINQQTGQITTTFDNNPQLPFSKFQLTLQGGERATLANPRSCGAGTTSVDMTPWSTPYTPDATPTSTFDVSENCFGPQFAPSFTAGTTSNQAGDFSPFTVSFGRSDSDEFLNGLQVKMPAGLLGMLSRVTLCGEPQAAEGTCGPESLIGETSVETGPGADPFVVTGGKVYITGAYKGAPYGLSIVVPAAAGPYTLAGTTGKGTVVVRSAINVNPETAALTVTADPLPTELDGIPLQLRLVNVTINRQGFIFNPTSCDPLQIAATLTSTQNTTANGSSSFQVTNCGALAFKPKFTVSTSGKTSKAGGASLDAKVSFPTGAQGSQADIHYFKVDLPKQLPSRLTTLQKACVAAVFEANPANCPAASVIGTAKVKTPVLPVQLTGPVYFVSHGGEAFPSLEIVLQGDGVRVDVVAATFISRAGITSSTFKTVPDVPFESFELYLPEGKYSALAANGNLCTTKLAMPTAIIAQNGKEIHESTKIAVTGCPEAKTAAKKGKKASNARKSSSRKGGRS